MARGFLGSVIGGDARISMRRNIFRCERLRQPDQRANAGFEQLRVAAVGVQTRECAAAMHIVAAAGRERFAAAGERMADYRVPALDDLDRAADLLDPSGILVA